MCQTLCQCPSGEVCRVSESIFFVEMVAMFLNSFDTDAKEFSDSFISESAGD